MDRLSHVLPKVLRKRGLADHAAGAFAVYKAGQWLKEHFPGLERNIHARMVKDHVLIVECTHSIALQEVKNAETELIAYMGQECPLAGIGEIRILRI